MEQLINWNKYSTDNKPNHSDYYLVAWSNGIHIVFRESFWERKKQEFFADDKKVQYWVEINWPY